jgi:hypothetical protein
LRTEALSVGEMVKADVSALIEKNDGIASADIPACVKDP